MHAVVVEVNTYSCKSIIGHSAAVEINTCSCKSIVGHAVAIEGHTCSCKPTIKHAITLGHAIIFFSNKKLKSTAIENDNYNCNRKQHL